MAVSVRFDYRATRISASSVTAELDPAAIDATLVTMASDGWRAVSTFFDARIGHVPSLTIIWERVASTEARDERAS